MKKVLILCLALALAVGTAVTGTVAYLQDTDEAINVAIVGNVDIEQLELQRKDKTKYEGLLQKGDLVPYEQYQNLFPAFPKTEGEGTESPYHAEMDKLLRWGPYVTADSDGTASGAGNGLWNPEKINGVMDKMVFVQNTGKSDCYYRTWIAFECPVGMEYSEVSDKEFMYNINGSTTYFTLEEYLGNKDAKTYGYVNIKDKDTGKDVRYLVIAATYNKVLKPGEISRPSLLQVLMTHRVGNEEVKLLDGSYEILVYTQAVQTENFDNAEQALNAAFWDVGAKDENGAFKTPWGEGYSKPAQLPEGFPKAEVDGPVNEGMVISEDAEDSEYKLNDLLNVLDRNTVSIDSGVYTFAAKETLEEAQANKFADWYADFHVSFSRDMNVGMDTTGIMEAALVGHYEGFAWVPVTAADVPGNEFFGLLGAVGGEWRYTDIVDLVNIFKCGVVVDPEEKGLDIEPFTLTVELRLTNPENADEYYRVGEPIVYTYHPEA